MFRRPGRGDDGFILLESVIAITVITIVMAAVGAEFIGGMVASSQQRTQQGAVQIASSTMEQIRALKPTDLLSGRDSTSVNEQFTNAIPAVAARLATMGQDSDPTVASGGISAAIPTCGDNTVPQPAICNQTPGTVTYRIRQYLGKCYIAASGRDCLTASGAGSVKYLRAVVAVIWDGPRCGSGCSYVTSTLVSTAADVNFRIDATPYPPPIITAPLPQTHIIGDTLGSRPGDKPQVELKVNDGTGARPLNWTIVSGSLPAGLTLDSLTGLISGTIAERNPAAPITTNYTYPAVTIQVTDAFARTSPSVTLSWTVKPALLLTVPASQSTVVNTAATSRTLTAQYGAGPTFTYSIVNNPLPNNLPPGLSLNATTGVISGTPTTVGTYTVSAKVLDNGNAHSDIETFTWTVTKAYGARYDFEEGTGTTAADSTGHDNTATLRPGAGWTTGKVNTKALSLTGTSDSWASAPTPVVDTTGSLTIAAWVKLDALSGAQGIAGLEGTKVPPFVLQRRNDGSFAFTSWRGDAITNPSASVVSTDKPTTGVWYHVAGVYDSTANTIELYVNGVSQGTTPLPSSFKATGSTIIGRNLSDGLATDFFKGALDDVRFFDRPLTSADVNDLVALGASAAGPTGGSVDATGLTGPGSRYSTSTTLNLALAKGTDPDGVAAGGAQLFRATATLAAGACGTYGTYAQVGTDNPATPFTNTVVDGACYRYSYRVADSLGNSTAYVSPDIKIDATAPTTGTLTYPNRSSSNTSVSIGFTTGTDAGSGVGTRLLQRSSAPLTGTTCGTYGGFTTVAGGTNPTSPLVDTVTVGSCYRYQYVVSDLVGNTGAPATSTNVVKVGVSYASTVAATPGLLNWFRLGDTADSLSSDSFTDAAETPLPGHTGELGAAWSAYVGTDLAKVSSANRLYRSGTNYSGYYTSAVPTSPDYSVQADLVFRSNIQNDYAGVIGRVATGSATFYGARWQQGNGNGSWVIYEYNNGAFTSLATTAAASRTVNQTNRLKLEMVGTAIKLYVDGVLTASATDATITAAGRGGILDGTPGASIAKTDNTGIQYDNFSIATVPRATDSKGTSTGTYFNGVLLGVAGAVADAADSAATFDGVDDYARVPNTIKDDFSIEFWFKSTRGVGTGNQWWQGVGMVDADVFGDQNDFGVSLRADGRVVAGVGTPDVSIVSTAGGYNDGGWHHVVFTRVKNSGVMRLYVDGAFAGTATGSTQSLTSPTTIDIGRSHDDVRYLAGSLDEVALYNVALSQATVTSHYDAGQ